MCAFVVFFLLLFIFFLVCHVFPPCRYIQFLSSVCSFETQTSRTSTLLSFVLPPPPPLLPLLPPVQCPFVDCDLFRLFFSAFDDICFCTEFFGFSIVEQ